MDEREKLNDRTCIVLTNDIKTILTKRAEANGRSLSYQLRRDLADYYRIITEGGIAKCQ